MGAVWAERPIPAAAASALRTAGFDPIEADLLAQRGVNDVEGAKTFLEPSLADLHDPASLPGIPEAVERILAARGSGPLVVVGDYDVDGVTATALLVAGLGALGFEAEAILPSRRAGGYGLQVSHVERACRRGAALLVTADCGTSAHEALAAARRAGLDVVIVDHHLPDETPPLAAAWVNPWRSDASAPFRDLCAAAIAAKLVAELFLRLGREAPWDALLRLACLGTIADVMPLVGENRAIARLGLAALPHTPSPGLRALLERAAVRPPCSAFDVAFRLGPRLNAPGRLADADPALELLLTRSAARGAELADALERDNRRRQELERIVLSDCEREFGSRRDDAAFVAWSDRWHPGVVGIAAGRMARELGRPAILLAGGGAAGATGSGRSVEGFDLHAALVSLAPVFQRFGGHAQAIGLTVAGERLERAREQIVERVLRLRGASPPPPVTTYDRTLPLAAADLPLARRIERLEPFGAGNPEPVFRLGPLRTSEKPRRFGDSHLRFEVGDGVNRAAVVAWRWAELSSRFEGDFELLAALEVDRWGGAERPRFRLVDVGPDPAAP